MESKTLTEQRIRKEKALAALRELLLADAEEKLTSRRSSRGGVGRRRHQAQKCRARDPEPVRGTIRGRSGNAYRNLDAGDARKLDTIESHAHRSVLARSIYEYGCFSWSDLSHTIRNMLRRYEVMHPFSCFNRAREDEMVFVLLGRDVAAAPAIRAWANARIELGKNKAEDHQIKEALDFAKIMESESAEWQALERERYQRKGGPLKARGAESAK